MPPPDSYLFQAEVGLRNANKTVPIDTETNDTPDNYDPDMVPSRWIMVKHPIILRNFIVMIISYCCMGTNFHTMAFYMKYIKGELYLL